MNKARLRFLLLLFLGFSLSYGLWIAAASPAVMSADSLVIWNEIQTGQYTDAHPIFYTMLIKLLTLGGQHLLLASIGQSLLMFAATLTLFRSLSGPGTWTRGVFFSFALGLTPYAGTMAITIWKDVAATSFLILGISFLILSFEKCEQLSPKSVYLAIGFTFMVVSGLSRHNFGPAIALTGILVFLFASLFRAKATVFRPTVALALVAFLAGILAIGLNTTVSKLWSAAPRAEFVEEMTFMSDLAFLSGSQNPSVPKAIDDYIDTFSSEAAAIAQFNSCPNLNPFIYHPDTRWELASVASKDAIDFWRVGISSSPELVAQVRICRASAFLPPPLVSGPTGVYWTHWGIDPNSMGIEVNPISSKLHTAMSFWRAIWEHNAKVLAWPGLLTVFGLVALRFQKVLLPVRIFLGSLLLSSILILIAFSPAQDFRYALPNTLISITLVTVAIVNAFTSRKSIT